jgi:hypothetical protein
MVLACRFFHGRGCSDAETYPYEGHSEEMPGLRLLSGEGSAALPVYQLPAASVSYGETPSIRQGGVDGATGKKGWKTTAICRPVVVNVELTRIQKDATLRRACTTVLARKS